MIISLNDDNMKLTQEKTYKVVKEILAGKTFRQLEISRSTGVSFGQVNKVVNWLVELGYVTKGKEGYSLRGAVAIVNIFPLYRQMKNLLIGELSIDIDNKQLIDALKRNKGALCLTSALQEYDSYYRDSAVRVYGDDKLLKELGDYEKGNTKIEIYRDDIGNERDMVNKEGIPATDEIRTVIDLYCSSFAYASDRLVRRLWMK